MNFKELWYAANTLNSGKLFMWAFVNKVMLLKRRLRTVTLGSTVEGLALIVLMLFSANVQKDFRGGKRALSFWKKARWYLFIAKVLVLPSLVCGSSFIPAVPALPSGELGSCLERWAKVGAKKYNCVVQKVTNIDRKKRMNMMKVNETHVHAVYEKIKVLHYFSFAADRLIFFLLMSISHILCKICRNLL